MVKFSKYVVILNLKKKEKEKEIVGLDYNQFYN